MTEITQETKDTRLEAELGRYLKIFSNDPKSRAFAPLGETYRKLGMLDEAIGVLEEGIKVHPNDPSGHLSLARCYGDKGESLKAIGEYRTVIKFAPDNLLAYRLIAGEYKKVKDDKSLIDIYQKIIKLWPKEEEALNYLSEKGLLKQSEPPKPAPPKKTPEPKNAGQPKIQEDKGSPFEDEPTLAHVDPAALKEEKLKESILTVPSPENVPPLESHTLSKNRNDEETPENGGKKKLEFYTATLAEIYAKQGLAEEAGEIYEFLIKRDPDNGRYREALSKLRAGPKKGQTPKRQEGAEIVIEGSGQEAASIPKEGTAQSLESSMAKGEEISLDLPLADEAKEQPERGYGKKLEKLEALLSIVASKKRKV